MLSLLYHWEWPCILVLKVVIFKQGPQILFVCDEIDALVGILRAGR